MMRRRYVAASLGASLLPLPARADDFPDRPITLVVPFTAGGSIDVLARLAAQQAGAAHRDDRSQGDDSIHRRAGPPAQVIGVGPLQRRSDWPPTMGRFRWCRARCGNR